MNKFKVILKVDIQIMKKFIITLGHRMNITANDKN